MNLCDDLKEILRLNELQKKALDRIGIKTIKDLLFHFPLRYADTADIKNINTLSAGENVVIFGKVENLKTKKGFRTKIPMGEGNLIDETGQIKIVWFNQPYLAKMIPEGSIVRVEGKISKRKKTEELYFSNPKIEKVEKLPEGTGDSLFADGEENKILYPIYKETRGITSNWIYHSIKKIFLKGLLDNVTDYIPDEILQKYHLPSLKTALVWIHSPKTPNDALSARKRFSFEEVFFIQLERKKERNLYAKFPAPIIKKDSEKIKGFLERFSFTPTEAQIRTIDEILKDTERGHPMGRLLEGDVGSGKTLVASVASYATINTRPANQNFGTLQVAYMAPTEILATQHFESFIKYFSHLPINIALITGSTCRKFPSKVSASRRTTGWTQISKSQLLKWVAGGEISIVIGTHALIQKSVKFKNLGLVIIDEQHRFGTAQRQKLARKDGSYPHLLSMTATPIPRTLALTIFGDLDLSLLDQMPAGRKKIETEIINTENRTNVYKKIKLEIKNGRQAYIICPRIDEPDPNKETALLAKSVKEEAKRLKKTIFKEFEIGVLHGKLKDSEKEKVMNDFKSGKIHILVATSVVEVGVNVPNATMIIIEGAERFGLSQLHQLGGRGR
jgi:ATP-dependent DNA helicase RecG